MDNLIHFASMLVHIDKYLELFSQQYGVWVYAILFAIIFAETGLVVAPFLPGDSLLFIAGAFCAAGSMNLVLLLVLLLVAAGLGNTVNYGIGAYLGHKVFTRNYRFLDRQALQKTHAFYEKHGGKTVIMSRFLPLFRTFAPFVAGVSGMTLARFQLFNWTGAVLWVGGLTIAGYFFGNIPFVRQYLNLIVLIGISAAIVPLLIGGLFKLWKSIRKNSLIK